MINEKDSFDLHEVILIDSLCEKREECNSLLGIPSININIDWENTEIQNDLLIQIRSEDTGDVFDALIRLEMILFVEEAKESPQPDLINLLLSIPEKFLDKDGKISMHATYILCLIYTRYEKCRELILNNNIGNFIVHFISSSEILGIVSKLIKSDERFFIFFSNSNLINKIGENMCDKEITDNEFKFSIKVMMSVAKTRDNRFISFFQQISLVLVASIPIDNNFKIYYVIKFFLLIHENIKQILIESGFVKELINNIGQFSDNLIRVSLELLLLLSKDGITTYIFENNFLDTAHNILMLDPIYQKEKSICIDILHYICLNYKDAAYSIIDPHLTKIVASFLHNGTIDEKISCIGLIQSLLPLLFDSTIASFFIETDAILLISQFIEPSSLPYLSQVLDIFIKITELKDMGQLPPYLVENFAMTICSTEFTHNLNELISNLKNDPQHTEIVIKAENIIQSIDQDNIN